MCSIHRACFLAKHFVRSTIPTRVFKTGTLKDRHLLMLFSDYRRPLRVHARAAVVVLFAASASARS